MSVTNKPRDPTATGHPCGAIDCLPDLRAADCVSVTRRDGHCMSLLATPRRKWSIDEFGPYEIVGFGFAGYRSFWRSSPEPIGPFGKLHLVAGSNNSGKSNILRFASTVLSTFDPGALTIVLPTGSDLPIGVGVTTTFRLDLLIAVPADFGLSQLSERVPEHLMDIWTPRLDALLATLTSDRTETRRVLRVQLVESERSRGQLQPDLDMAQRACAEYSAALPGDTGLQELIVHLIGYGPGGTETDFMAAFCRWVVSLTSMPPVAEVSAFRQISSGENENFSGSGLIRRLAELENPPSHDVYDANIARFEGINRFVQSVIGDESARIRVTSGQDDILVVASDRVLPLASLGTGIHEVIILALAATLLSGHLVCMEEPEIHMHPVMQRRLLTYLAETDNRYLVATHSAALLDQSLASISHIKLDHEGSRLTASATSQDVSHLVSDLGYRASDIVQANSVLWVEGPSDRNYLRFWLSVVDPDLVEGVHYSIMFYGGGLLSHLAAEDLGVKDFIALRRLNRNSVIVIDSDRTSAEKEINATKRRVRREFNDDAGNGFAWVTWGYTIENYVPRHLLEAAVKAVHSRTKYTFRAGRFTNPLAGSRFSNKTFTPDKTAISANVVANWLPTDALPDELLSDVRKLSKTVRLANGLDPKVFAGRPPKANSSK